MTDINGLKTDQTTEAQWQRLKSGHDEDMRAYGFERSFLGTFFTYFSFVITVGWARLFFHWYPHLYLYATHKKCSLREATKILVIDDYQGKHKSYFVEEVQQISLRNASGDIGPVNLGGVDEGLLTQIREKCVKINLENGTKREVEGYRVFRCKKQCYIWDETRNEFSRLVGLDRNVLRSELASSHAGLSKEEQLLRRIVYGTNEIIVPVQSIGVLLVLEALNPFYIFQVFTLAVWLAEGYYYYTGAIICMSLFGITSTILQTRKNQMNLHGTVASTETVRVRRENGIFENVSSANLVPGDVIELPKHQGTVACDAVLLTGSCILNESMLTGESVPVVKTPLRPNGGLYEPKESSHHTLFSGTIIIQTRTYGNDPVLAKVIKTGFQTSRGALVAAILYPPPADFKFDRDSYKFIGILALIATFGFIYTVVSKMYRGTTAGHIAIEALDVFTIAIPPALPAAMTVGKLYAQARLKRAQIYCINSRVINVSGSTDCVCFDKTGTLTEDGLDVWGAVPSTKGTLCKAEKDITNLKEHLLFEGMLVCHSLTLIDGELCGDPLDVKMFESTGWILEEPNTEESLKYSLMTPTIVRPPANYVSGNNIQEIEIVHRYQFSSTLQRMSSVARISGEEHFVTYTKGSPEMILSLSRPETIPGDITVTLRYYTEQGYRVIAIGRAILQHSFSKIEGMTRDMVEQDLEFLGLVILENRLKPATVQVIRELREANINVVMITGDNIQTAVSVAKECGILLPDEIVIDVTVVPGEAGSSPQVYFTAQGLPLASTLQKKKVVLPTLENVENGLSTRKYKFALTGRNWELLCQYYENLLPKICVRGAVFARMSSDQKQQLVLELMQLGYYVAMCGDGANDCGALRAAHVGISLSEAESSVASPFTSRIPDITCVPKVIREGRAALVTSIGIFKLMVTYSLTELLSVIVLYSIDSNLTDLQFLFIDLCLIVNFAFFLGKTQAFEGKLARRAPTTSLISFSPIMSIVLQMLSMTVFQVSAFHIVRSFPWFESFAQATERSYSCYENYSVFCVSMFQYITMAVVFSKGKPYRKAIYTNRAFISSIFLMIAICAYIAVSPAQWIINALQLIVPPTYDWRLLILLLSFANFTTCLFMESFIIEYMIERVIKPRLHKPEKSKRKYLGVEDELTKNCDWPVVTLDLPCLPVTPSVESFGKSLCFGNGDDKSYKIENEIACNGKSVSTDSEKNDTKGIENPAFVGDESVEFKMITKL
ncbi:probable cation-transporting ATPase 13A3 [Orussus abietinus]|uniref:probable cation-transporting ATPase 13A3 n=1 Tax=Orussus abietinus TaxID=222816 RepID=UPI00062532DF|nr:probable cation-transporting ATPase 13A3 [Orussus abietinus]XP_012274125.1 probable cation-transporting ATPase 13A3 [Orussus abietinus]XP_012274126.1 probable cation-transporting ATPase 13A3 [Orussus abietinus]